MNKVGTGSRVINFLIDTMLIFLISYVVSRIHHWYVVYYRIHNFRFAWFFWGILILYYLFFEAIFARTPGKWLSFTRVVNHLGQKPGFVSILIRTLVRCTTIDLFFMPFIDKTLHDFLSKTDVVEI